MSEGGTPPARPNRTRVAPAPPPRRIESRDDDITSVRSLGPPPPAVVGPPPVPPSPAVVGPPPIPGTANRGMPAANRGRGVATRPAPTPVRMPTPNKFVVSLEPTVESSLYFPLIEIIIRENRIMARAIMNATDTADADFLAHALVNVFASTKAIFEFLMLVIIDEVTNTENPGTLFRGNCLATKVLSSYALLIAKSFLKQLLTQPIQHLLDNSCSYEIDPNKLGPNDNLETNLANCRRVVKMFLDVIINSIDICPMVVRGICFELRRHVAEKFPASVYTVIGGFYFLRFICPAIVSPEGFGIFERIPDETRRPLVIISKVIQNLGNNLEFGKKEAYMIPLNDLIVEYLPRVRDLCDKLVIVEHDKIVHPPVNVDEVQVFKLYKHVYLLQDKIIKSISFLELTCGVPPNSENSLFTQVLEYLGPPEQLNNEDDKKSKKKKSKK